MAIYHLHTSPASRSSGKSAVAMAAYRSGGKLLDMRTGEVKDYSRKQGITETVLLYPDSVSFDRQTLWNMAEAAEKRKDSRITREIRVALPCELDQLERSKLVKEFAQDIVNRYGIAVDLSIHQPDRQGDNRNFHAHLMLTTRQITPNGLSEKSDLELSDRALKQAGKLNGKEQILELRQQWENLCNLALERQGHEQRISAKSYEERKITREPTIHLGPAATAMERRGIETDLGTWNRIVTKLNLSQAIQEKIDCIERAYKALTVKLAELKNELKRGITQALQPESKSENKAISIDQLLTDGARKMPDNSQEFKKSVESLLNSQKEQQETLEKEAEERRKLSVEELLNRKQPYQEKSLKIKRGGLEY